MAAGKFVTYKGEGKGFQDQLGWRWQETCILPKTALLIGNTYQITLTVVLQIGVGGGAGTGKSLMWI